MDVSSTAISTGNETDTENRLAGELKNRQKDVDVSSSEISTGDEIGAEYRLSGDIRKR